MSRPIYEPSLTRTDEAIAFGSRQLFRRPFPGGGDTQLPYAFMEWLDGGDVPDDAELGPEDLGGGTPYTDCFVNGSGMVLTSPTANPPVPFTPDLVEGVINFNAPGLYLAQFMATWADTWTDGTDYAQTKLNYIGNALVGACCSWATREPMFNDWQIANNVGTGMFISTNTQTPPHAGIKGTVWQKSGGDKFLTQAALMIVKLADFDTDDGYFCES